MSGTGTARRAERERTTRETRIRAVVDASTGELTGLRPIDGSAAPLRVQK